MNMYPLCLHYNCLRILEKKLVLIVVFTLEVATCRIWFTLTTVILSLCRLVHCCSAKRESVLTCASYGYRIKIVTNAIIGHAEYLVNTKFWRNKFLRFTTIAKFKSSQIKRLYSILYMYTCTLILHLPYILRMAWNTLHNWRSVISRSIIIKTDWFVVYWEV